MGSGGAARAGPRVTKLEQHTGGSRRVSICSAITRCAAQSRITGPSSHIYAVDSGPAVDYRYWVSMPKLHKFPACRDRRAPSHYMRGLSRFIPGRAAAPPSPGPAPAAPLP